MYVLSIPMSRGREEFRGMTHKKYIRNKSSKATKQSFLNLDSPTHDFRRSDNHLGLRASCHSIRFKQTTAPRQSRPIAKTDRNMTNIKKIYNKLPNGQCLREYWNERSGHTKKDTAVPEVGPIERERMLRKKPPDGYYWPSRPPPSSAGSVSTSSPPQPSETVSTAEVTIPIILVSPSSPTPEPEATTQAPGPTQSNPDQSKLTPLVPKRSRKKRSRSAKQQRDREIYDDFMAPKPSIFSFDLCKHPRCPLEYSHEKEIFRRTWVLRIPSEIPEGEFGNFRPCDPPLIIMCAVGRVEKCKKRQQQGRLCPVDQEDVDMVEGFYEAHCRETETKID